MKKKDKIRSGIQDDRDTKKNLGMERYTKYESDGEKFMKYLKAHHI